jgi:hypothetical protein
LIRVGGVALVVAAAAVLGAGAAAAGSTTTVAKKPPRALWNQYPLGSSRTTTFASSSTKSSPNSTAKNRRQIAPTHARTGSGDGSRTSRLAGAGMTALGLLATGAILAIWAKKRRKGGKRVRDFLRHGRNDELDVGPVGAEAPESVTERVKPWTEPGDRSEAEPVKAAELAGVGEHIASVLAAAEAAAAKLRADTKQEAITVRKEAEQTANDVRRRAKEESEKALASAQQESEKARASAQQMLKESEAASKDVRADADRYAVNRRREADSQAAKLVFEAERNAASVADTSKERHRVVLTNIATSEARLRELAKSLRGVASALDTVVGDGQGEETVAAAGGENLDESLRQRAATPEGQVHQ